jgi:vitamin B12 transporter
MILAPSHTLACRYPAQRVWNVGKATALLIISSICGGITMAHAEEQPEATSAAAAPTSEVPLDVNVQGESRAERLQKSAQAVHVVTTEQAQLQTADLGEVLARTQGVGVQRGGGLGSQAQISLNGLTGDQVRFFLDGLPLELSGYPFGLANVPVNLVERIEVYRGVVPVRFGADALGGAINLVTNDSYQGTHGSASYQVGSFGTHRATVGAQHLHERSGFFTRASGFFDYADNDYPVDVEVNNDGQPEPVRAYRFHDAYRAEGGNLEVGFVHRPWAKRLLLRAFITDYRKELQHDVVMERPYGDAEYGELAAGGTLRYEHRLSKQISVEGIAGYSHTTTDFEDLGTCVYNWLGQCVRPRPQPGEIVGRPQDQVFWEQSGFGRAHIEWRIHPDHVARASISPTFVSRTGDERRQVSEDARDPLSARRELLTLVSGLEYQVDLFDARLQNILFAKSYLQVLRSEDPQPDGDFVQLNRDTHRFGIGDSFRQMLVDSLYAKASYEWATRLPRPDEVFGDGFPVLPNLNLEPELSHNANLGLTLDAMATDVGSFRSDLNGFWRDAHQLIILIGDSTSATYQNVYNARSLGVEAAAGWTSLGDYVELDANITYVDQRNTSSEGAFANQKGSRIPNRPYLYANGSLRLEARSLATAKDEVSLVWNTRYVHGFLRGWEDIGAAAHKLTIDSQLLHSLALTYLVASEPRSLSFTTELQNLTNAPAFDFYGVQKPGRSIYFKTTASF